MSQKVTPAADCTSKWPYPLESDGWFRAHNALRADLAALSSMLRSFQLQLAAGMAITRSQAARAYRFIYCFLKFLHHHHRNEDDIAMPYLATRFAIPEKIVAGHGQLEALMDRFDLGTKKLLASTNPAVQRNLLVEAETVFIQLRALCEEHFRDEEEEAMPLMRRHFTPKEIERNVVQKIMRSMDGEGVGAFLRPMSKAERRAFARQEGIPFFIRWILFRHAAKYERNVWQPFQRECLAAVRCTSALRRQH